MHLGHKRNEALHHLHWMHPEKQYLALDQSHYIALCTLHHRPISSCNLDDQKKSAKDTAIRWPTYIFQLRCQVPMIRQCKRDLRIERFVTSVYLVVHLQYPLHAGGGKQSLVLVLRHNFFSFERHKMQYLPYIESWVLHSHVICCCCNNFGVKLNCLY